MVSISKTLTDNPIARAELSHQQRAPHLKQRWHLIFIVGLSVALISQASLLVVPQIADLLGVSADDLSDLLRDWLGIVTVFMGALIMVQHLSFSRVGLQIASASISREKQGRTWESLLMTGMDARRIVLGKWSATLRTLWQVYRPLLFLRFAAALWIGIAGENERSTFYSAAPLTTVLLIAAVVAVFPLCYTAFTTALGLLVSAITRSETTAYHVASLFQFGLFVISLCLILIAFTRSFDVVEPGLIVLIPALIATPLDGGMLALLGLIAGNGESSGLYLIGLVACSALQVGLAWLTLRVAQSLTVRQRALPPV